MPIVRNSEMSNKWWIETSSIFTASLLCLKMAVYEVFSHPEIRRYKTHVCTKATLITFIVLFLVVIPPLFVVYRSYGKLKFVVFLYFSSHFFLECKFMHALIMLMWWIYLKCAEGWGWWIYFQMTCPTLISACPWLSYVQEIHFPDQGKR